MLLQTFALWLLQTGVVTAQLAYADNQAPLQKDNAQVAAIFPDVDEVELYSPAFTSPRGVPAGFSNGTSGPTSLQKLDDFVRKIAKRHSWITYHDELESEEGRVIPYVTLSTTSSRDKGKAKKLRVWLQGGVHGNEPAGDESILSLLGKFDRDSRWARKILAKIDVAILPRYNVDGVEYFQRQLASNFDPNRDHAILKSQQSVDIKTVLSNYDPHIFLDAHEYTASSQLRSASSDSRRYQKPEDSQTAHVKNHNVHKAIRELGEGLFKSSIRADLAEHGLRWSEYYTTAGPSGSGLLTLSEPSSGSRPSHNNAGLLQAVSFLSETRGIRLGDQHFQRRVVTGQVVAESLLNTATDNFDHVYKTIENARREFTDSTADIIVTDSSRPHNTTWEFVDSATGELVQFPVIFTNNTPTIVELTRPRPKAYVFSKAFAPVAERLRASGVKVEVLKKDFVGEVDVLRVTSAVTASQKYEGVAETTVETEAFRKQVRIPQGGFRVDTKQKNAAYALVTLEPENVASYVTYNIVPLDEGDEYPIFRVL